MKRSDFSTEKKAKQTKEHNELIEIKGITQQSILQMLTEGQVMPGTVLGSGYTYVNKTKLPALTEHTFRGTSLEKLNISSIRC